MDCVTICGIRALALDAIIRIHPACALIFVHHAAPAMWVNAIRWLFRACCVIVEIVTTPTCNAIAAVLSTHAIDATSGTWPTIVRVILLRTFSTYQAVLRRARFVKFGTEPMNVLNKLIRTVSLPETF